MGFLFHTEKFNFEEETRFCAHTPYKTGVQRCAKSMWRQWTEAITRKSYVRTVCTRIDVCDMRARCVPSIVALPIGCWAGRCVGLQPEQRTGDLAAAQTVFCPATPVAAADTGACCAKAVMAGSAGKVTALVASSPGLCYDCERLWHKLIRHVVRTQGSAHCTLV